MTTASSPSQFAPPIGGLIEPNDLLDLVSGADGAGSADRPADDKLAPLVQLQKLAAMGTMAAMLAHEFNNLLTRAINHADYALHGLDDRAAVAASLKKVMESCGRAAEISQSIFDFAGKSDGGRRPVEVARLVRDAIDCLGRDPSRDNIAIRSRISPGLTIQGNATLLQQVLYNLVLNARQAILSDGNRRGGRITVSADRHDGQVLIRVVDTGCGIAPQDLEKIFTPFHSTKSNEYRTDRRGIGLGLAICRFIVARHDGRIDVESTPGEGTTFTVTLPEEKPSRD